MHGATNGVNSNRAGYPAESPMCLEGTQRDINNSTQSIFIHFPDFLFPSFSVIYQCFCVCADSVLLNANDTYITDPGILPRRCLRRRPAG